MIKVVKFGGSSVASAEQFKKVKNIIESDDKRRVVVVSALGKRCSEDNKITDLLYLLSSHIKYGVDFSNITNILFDRYEEVRKNLGIDFDLAKEFDNLKEQIKNGVSEEFIVSRGEFLCAKLMSKYLNFTFVDAVDVIFFNYDGSLNHEKTKQAVLEAFEKYGKIVVPGFYGAYPTGDVKLFSRGGSDITGSILSMAINAEMYENWTDVSGILKVDPRIINNPQKIDEITYEELRELSYMGASVLHEETIFPIKDMEIPINIKNTNRPEDEGTLILKESNDKSSIVTGISGKKNFKVFNIVKEISEDKIKIIQEVLSIFSNFKVVVEHIPTSIDSFSVIVSGKNVDKHAYDIIACIKKIKGVLSVSFDDDLSLIAVVGRNMILKAGISGQLFSIFGKNNINIKTVVQDTREIDIIVGVANSDFEKSIKALYKEMVEA